MQTKNQLRASLSLFDIVALGVGTLVGVGIFVVAGVTAATISGPSVVVSFIIAGIAALLAALCYTEMAAAIGGSGGAYTYLTAAFNKTVGTAGGILLLCIYILIVPYLAAGWSGYFVAMLHSAHIVLPDYLTHAYYEKNGGVNIPAIGIILLTVIMLLQNSKRGARLNTTLVAVKLGVILIFLVSAGKYIRFENWKDFMPFGFHGTIQGAAMVFTAYLGFDILASAVAEAKNPQRTIPWGMALTFLISMGLYVLVAMVLTTIQPYATLNDPASVSNAMIRLHLNWVAAIISLGAVFGITAVIFGFAFAASRVFYALVQNGALPKYFGELHPKTNVPHRAILVCGTSAVILSVFIPFMTAIKYINLGCLIIYSLVCLSVIWLRVKNPTMQRPFKLPLNPLIPVLGIMACVYLIISLYK